MSHINGTVYEMKHISQMAMKDHWMNQIHPMVKLFLTFSYIVLVVSFPKYELAGVLSMAVYPILAMNLADLSWGVALRRLRLILPVVCIVGIFNPFLDREILTYIGGMTIHFAGHAMEFPVIGIRGGVVSMLSLMVKGILTVFASYLLIATTSVERICYAMRLLHLPKGLVAQMMLIYRYMTLLLGEARRITQAYALRAPGQKGIRMEAWGSLVGQLLLRSMDRADEVYESMCLRGFTGEFPEGKITDWKGRKRVRDLMWCIVWFGIFLLCRMVPVFQVVGGLFA